MIQPNDDFSDAPADPASLLRDTEPGTVIYAFAEGDEPLVEFLIRETSDAIARAGGEVQLRAGIVTECGVPVPVALFKFPPADTVYRTFWNYCSDGGKALFAHLASGPSELCVKFVGDLGTVEKLLTFRHPLDGFFRNAAALCGGVRPWDEDRFYDALDAMQTNSGSAAALWDVFGGAPGEKTA